MCLTGEIRAHHAVTRPIVDLYYHMFDTMCFDFKAHCFGAYESIERI